MLDGAPSTSRRRSAPQTAMYQYVPPSNPAAAHRSHFPPRPIRTRLNHPHPHKLNNSLTLPTRHTRHLHTVRARAITSASTPIVLARKSSSARTSARISTVIPSTAPTAPGVIAARLAKFVSTAKSLPPESPPCPAVNESPIDPVPVAPTSVTRPVVHSDHLYSDHVHPSDIVGSDADVDADIDNDADVEVDSDSDGGNTTRTGSRAAFWSATEDDHLQRIASSCDPFSWREAVRRMRALGYDRSLASCKKRYSRLRLACPRPRRAPPPGAPLPERWTASEDRALFAITRVYALRTGTATHSVNWEDVSSAMRGRGYNRSAHGCKKRRLKQLRWQLDGWIVSPVDGRRVDGTIRPQGEYQLNALDSDASALGQDNNAVSNRTKQRGSSSVRDNDITHMPRTDTSPHRKDTCGIQSLADEYEDFEYSDEDVPLAELELRRRSTHIPVNVDPYAHIKVCEDSPVADVEDSTDDRRGAARDTARTPRHKLSAKVISKKVRRGKLHLDIDDVPIAHLAYIPDSQSESSSHSSPHSLNGPHGESATYQVAAPPIQGELEAVVLPEKEVPDVSEQAVFQEEPVESTLPEKDTAPISLSLKEKSIPTAEAEGSPVASSEASPCAPDAVCHVEGEVESTEAACPLAPEPTICDVGDLNASSPVDPESPPVGSPEVEAEHVRPSEQPAATSSEAKDIHEDLVVDVDDAEVHYVERVEEKGDSPLAVPSNVGEESPNGNGNVDDERKNDTSKASDLIVADTQIPALNKLSHGTEIVDGCGSSNEEAGQDVEDEACCLSENPIEQGNDACSGSSPRNTIIDIVYLTYDLPQKPVADGAPPSDAVCNDQDATVSEEVREWRVDEDSPEIETIDLTGEVEDQPADDAEAPNEPCDVIDITSGHVVEVDGREDERDNVLEHFANAAVSKKPSVDSPKHQQLVLTSSAQSDVLHRMPDVVTTNDLLLSSDHFSDHQTVIWSLPEDCIPEASASISPVKEVLSNEAQGVLGTAGDVAISIDRITGNKSKSNEDPEVYASDPQVPPSLGKEKSPSAAQNLVKSGDVISPAKDLTGNQTSVAIIHDVCASDHSVSVSLGIGKPPSAEHGMENATGGLIMSTDHLAEGMEECAGVPEIEARTPLPVHSLESPEPSGNQTIVDNIREVCTSDQPASTVYDKDKPASEGHCVENASRDVFKPADHLAEDKEDYAGVAEIEPRTPIPVHSIEHPEPTNSAEDLPKSSPTDVLQSTIAHDADGTGPPPPDNAVDFNTHLQTDEPQTFGNERSGFGDSREGKANVPFTVLKTSAQGNISPRKADFPTTGIQLSSKTAHSEKTSADPTSTSLEDTVTAVNLPISSTNIPDPPSSIPAVVNGLSEALPETSIPSALSPAAEHAPDASIPATPLAPRMGGSVIPWRVEEEDMLLNILRERGKRPLWAAVSKLMCQRGFPRTARACRIRFAKIKGESSRADGIRVRQRRDIDVYWTPSQDTALISAVACTRLGNEVVWKSVSEKLLEYYGHTKSSRSCRLRFNRLQPDNNLMKQANARSAPGMGSWKEREKNALLDILRTRGSRQPEWERVRMEMNAMGHMRSAAACRVFFQKWKAKVRPGKTTLAEVFADMDMSGDNGGDMTGDLADDEDEAFDMDDDDMDLGMDEDTMDSIPPGVETGADGNPPDSDMEVDSAPPEAVTGTDATITPETGKALRTDPPEAGSVLDASPPGVGKVVLSTPPEANMVMDATPSEVGKAMVSTAPEVDVAMDATPLEVSDVVVGTPPEADMAMDATPSEAETVMNATPIDGIKAQSAILSEVGPEPVDEQVTPLGAQNSGARDEGDECEVHTRTRPDSVRDVNLNIITDDRADCTGEDNDCVGMKLADIVSTTGEQCAEGYVSLSTESSQDNGGKVRCGADSMECEKQTGSQSGSGDEQAMSMVRGGRKRKSLEMETSGMEKMVESSEHGNVMDKNKESDCMEVVAKEKSNRGGRVQAVRGWARSRVGLNLDGAKAVRSEDNSKVGAGSAPLVLRCSPSPSGSPRPTKRLRISEETSADGWCDAENSLLVHLCARARDGNSLDWEMVARRMQTAGFDRDANACREYAGCEQMRREIAGARGKVRLDRAQVDLHGVSDLFYDSLSDTGDSSISDVSIMRDIGDIS